MILHSWKLESDILTGPCYLPGPDRVTYTWKFKRSTEVDEEPG